MEQAHLSNFFVGVPGGLIMSFIAFSIVFIVIVGLMLVMMGMKHICAAIDSAKSAPAKPAPAHTPAAPASSQAVAAPAGDDDELLAVISAAVMAACGSAARVVSFRPVQAPSAASAGWRMIGRLQNTEGFQD